MDKERIENAIRHIQTATDVDPWAMEIAVEAMKAQLSEEGTTKGTTFDLISRQAAMDAFASLVPYAIDDAVTEAYAHGLSDGYSVICNLPSVQPSDSKIENAIRVLQTKYSKALSLDFIHNPVAWALYKTWKEFDK